MELETYGQRYVLVDSKSKKFFVEPSYSSWGFTDDENKVTVFSSHKQASFVADAVNNGVAATYWDWSDIPPNAVVVRI